MSIPLDTNSKLSTTTTTQTRHQPPSKIIGKPVMRDMTTIPMQLLPENMFGREANGPRDTQIFICPHPGCHRLYPSSLKLVAHQTATHPLPPDRVGQQQPAGITWIDPELEREAEAERRREKEAKMAEAARRSFLPLGSF